MTSILPNPALATLRKAWHYTPRDGYGGITFYRAPYESEGPHVRVEGGRQVMYYMYAYYVFRWPRGVTQVSVGHGTIDKHIGLLDNVSIEGEWTPESLIRFAQPWARAQLVAFQPPGDRSEVGAQ